MTNYYTLTSWFDENNPYESGYYTVTMLGEDHPRYVNTRFNACFDWASSRAQFVPYPGDRRTDDEDYLLADIYNDTGHRHLDGMTYEVLAVFRIED